ncbi:hypothetical protein M231_03454 [Tremella mesenterica]|uniref:N-acetyl-D-glucosamine kinase n=2 Tax=Tremella mesenterica TaxID=5217 RepID=A0A4Q1BN05_TREME|nr:hypothetical protein M231_03454 [Tremella mesenterica]
MFPPRLPTPPGSEPIPSLILCADGGGSKVCVVIRSRDGVEGRGTAGPCNVQSVGPGPAIQALLLATYRALSQLPRPYLPAGLKIPELPHDPQQPIQILPPPPPKPFRPGEAARILKASHLPALSIPSTPINSRPPSPETFRTLLPPLNVDAFQYAWLGLAGISTTGDARAFLPHVVNGLRIRSDRVKITNDVNLLAAPALDIGVKHVIAVVCGTGTVGRTIRVNQPVAGRATPDSDTGRCVPEVGSLPLEDVAVSRGWGYMLCDEGSAFWLGRLAIRLLLSYADRVSSCAIYASPPPPHLPLYDELLRYFGVQDPMLLIELTSLTSWEGSTGEAVARRNAMVAGSARIVLSWAFDRSSPPSPHALADPRSPDDPMEASRREARALAKKSIGPMIELTLDLLGDGSTVTPEDTALVLGGGLWQSRGYRDLLLEGLRKQGVVFSQVRVVQDAAGEGAKGLARVEFA